MENITATDIITGGKETNTLCKRILIGESKLGLCPDCLNKYGSPAAAVGIAGLAVGGRFLLKNSGKI